MNNLTETQKQVRFRLDTRNIAQIGVLSAISFGLMTLEFPLWFAPGFYQLDFSELPVLIGAFAMGPAAGAVIELMKVLLYLFLHGSSTAGVGDLANFIFGCSLVVPSAMIYRRHKSRRNALLGMAVGTLTMVLVGSVVNAYVLLPVYAAAFHMPIAGLVAAGTAVNPHINSISDFVLLAVAPFNLFKGVAVSCLTMLIYKRVSPILHNRIQR